VDEGDPQESRRFMKVSLTPNRPKSHSLRLPPGVQLGSIRLAPVTATANVRVVTEHRVARAGEAGIDFHIFAILWGCASREESGSLFVRARAVLESEAFHITNTPVDYSAVEVPTPTRGGVASPYPRLYERKTPVPLPLHFGLQRQGQVNFRRHLLRAVRRFSALMVADLFSFYVMRGLVRAVRDEGVSGTTISDILLTLAPTGILNGWQFAAALVVGLVAFGNYGPGDRRKDAQRLFWGCALATALPLWMTIWTRGLGIVAVQYALTTGLVWFGLIVERLLLDRVVERVAPTRRQVARTLFVGPAEGCRSAASNSAFAWNTEYRSVGFVDVHLPPARDSVGHIVDFATVLADSGAEVVVICGYMTDDNFHDVVDAALAAKCQVLSFPRAIDVAGVQPDVVWKRGQALIELHRPEVAAPALFIKRIADFIAASIGLILLSPVFGIVSLMIKLDSPGPIFFGSPRWGQRGRHIRIWKFRTMVDGATAILDTDPTLRAAYDQGVKLRLDPRVTRLGRLLRRWSIDELPQLYNVLIGEMSLVGPRPKLFGEEDRYGPLFGAILGVPPGITGLWQVSGRNDLSYENRIALDVDYVRRCSLLFDLRILAQTVPVVLRGAGAH
jgi:exopolysaccharide biosynthesis polyprenyl glycosylphosphotransferase